MSGIRLKICAKKIRTAVADLRDSTLPDSAVAASSAKRSNALATLVAIEAELETFSEELSNVTALSSSLPMQPIIVAPDGMIRFRKNPIVRDLLDFASQRGMTLNEIAMGEYSDEERMQFAQLIGYSLGGYSELSYVSDASVEAADAAAPRVPGRTPDASAEEG